MQILITGRRKVGKSLLASIFTGKDFSVMNNVAEQFSEPVNKSTEFFPNGQIIIADINNIENVEEIGKRRISEVIKAISAADFVIVVLDARERIYPEEWELINILNKTLIPFIIAVNKIEYGVNPALLSDLRLLNVTHFEISCAEKAGLDALKSKVLRMLPSGEKNPLIGDLVNPGDIIILVEPENFNSLKGRQILPVYKSIKEILEYDAIVILTKEKELRSTLYALKSRPDLVVTDSQSIERVAAELPEVVKLTTYSILTSRYKGDLTMFLKGLEAIDTLENGDKILVAEGCSYHEQADDSIRETLAGWFRAKTKKDLSFTFNTGDLPDNISLYKLIIHCGGCRLSRQTMHARIKLAALTEIPVINYGILLSFMKEALPRTIIPFGEEYSY